MNAETVKDSCPHRVQCATQEECDAKTNNDTTHAAPLGERLVKLALADMGATRSRSVVAIVKEGQGWRYTASYAADDRSLTTTGLAISRALAWQTVHEWMLFQLSDDGELNGVKVKEPSKLQVPTVSDFVPGAPTYVEAMAALMERGPALAGVRHVLTEERWTLLGDLERQKLLATVKDETRAVTRVAIDVCDLLVAASKGS